MNNRKLKIELVPESLWGFSLAKALPKKLWDIIRKDAISRSDGVCCICGAKSKILHGHETWSYNEQTKVQKLENVIAVCPLCHSAIHLNRSYVVGDFKRAEDQYMKVNGVSYAQMKQDLKQANEDNLRRSQIYDWTQNFDWLRRFDENV